VIAVGLAHGLLRMLPRADRKAPMLTTRLLFTPVVTLS
jgi:hypothetical protein